MRFEDAVKYNHELLLRDSVSEFICNIDTQRLSHDMAARQRKAYKKVFSLLKRQPFPANSFLLHTLELQHFIFPRFPPCKYQQGTTLFKFEAITIYFSLNVLHTNLFAKLLFFSFFISKLSSFYIKYINFRCPPFVINLFTLYKKKQFL